MERNVKSHNSIIVRSRITKALEEIVGGTDKALFFNQMKTTRRQVTKVPKKRSKNTYEKVKIQRLWGRYNSIMRELITERLVEGYYCDAEGIDPRFAFCIPDNIVRKYFSMPLVREENYY